MFRKIISLILSTILIFGLTSLEPLVYGKPSNNFSGKVDVGGYSMFIDIKGKRQHGLPTVVFESGMGDSQNIWDKVAPEIAKKTRIVTYDRIGIGQSDSPNRNKVDYTVKGTAKRLHTLLKKAGVNGPIVLVSHSMGGLYAREFQYLYPDKVKGIVFIESSTEHQEKYLFPELDSKLQQEIMQESLTNGTDIPVELSLNDLLKSYCQIDAAKVKDPLRKLPIEVLSGGKHGAPDYLPNFEVHWAERQAYITNLSKYSIHKINTNNGHYLQQENSSFVIDGINELLTRLKNN